MEFNPTAVVVYSKKKDQYVDRTHQVKSINYDANFAYITYSSSDVQYKYNRENVIELRLRETIDLTDKDVYVDGVVEDNLLAVGDYKSHYALAYKGSRKVVFHQTNQVKFRTSNTKSIREYLYAIASFQENNKESNQAQNFYTSREPFLASEMRKIKLNRSTVLSTYLRKTPIKVNSTPYTFIYPFDVNTSQKDAIKQALKHNISIIQGPPGTGKTQSILNLIANLVYNGKSVGIVSNNNSAVENVKEKLVNRGYGFLIAHLGNKSNRDIFFNETEFNQDIDSRWGLNQSTINKYTEALNKTGARLDKHLKVKDELAKTKEELKNTQRESEDYFSKFKPTELPIAYSKIKSWNSHKIIAFKTEISTPAAKSPLTNISNRLLSAIKYGKMYTSALNETGLELILALNSLIYPKKIKELKEKIIELEAYLANSDLDSLNKKYEVLSTALFNSSIYNRYSEVEQQLFTSESAIKNNFDQITKQFPVILSTTYSILSSIDTPLDYIIIDESSQVDLVTASLALSACRNVVVVGDSQQLTHIVGDELQRACELALQYNIPKEYNYVENNIISSLKSVFQDSLPSTLLKEHYRCNPIIIGFCNQKYYKGELIIMTQPTESKPGDRDFPLRLIHTVEGNHARGRVNERQIAVIDQEIIQTAVNLNPEDIGIITPYRNQADKITQTICQDIPVECDTIHRYQGREKKTIIFSTVANEITEFIDSSELINVAVSRAIDQFIMVMPHAYELKHGSNVGDLIRYIQRWNPEGITQSSVISYFDLLNKKSHSNLLDKFKLKVRGISKYETENIIETLLREIINENPSYSGLEIKSGYPLYLMIQNKEGLNERELSFCNNRLSHVDFLLINRCDNSFVLAIEVDGYTFHSQAKQIERDTIKDKVLAMNGINLLRLSTRGVSEKERILAKLKSL